MMKVTDTRSEADEAWGEVSWSSRSNNNNNKLYVIKVRIKKKKEEEEEEKACVLTNYMKGAH